AQAGAWDDPKLSADSVVGRFIDLPANAMPDQSLMLEQMLPVSGKNRARARAAAAEALSALEDVRRQELDILTAARTSFFRLTNAYAQLEINRKNIVSLKQIADISRNRYEVGNETAAGALVAQSDASKLLETQRDLERALANEQSQLNTLMNRDAFVSIGKPLDSSINNVSLSIERLRALALANRPEVRSARDKIEAEKSRLQMAHREWIPDPALSLRATRYNDAAQTVSELSAGVSFSLPWVNYRKYSAGTREAEKNIGAAQQVLDGAEKEAIRLLRDQLQKIETTHHHVELFRDEILPQAQQAFEATQLGYESGKSGFLDWITAQRTLRDAQATARAHLADYQIALAELDGIVGTELRK
ncbi:MAG: TolC family protein, partial [Verrucomicrobiota bacterium]|nr:TolC family protein [Verrucomicrobiota bacterium]